MAVQGRTPALEVARGRYVAFLDSDDRWLPGKLQLQIAAMDAAGAAASYGTYQRVAEDGRCLNLVVPPASLSHRDMLKSNRIGHSKIGSAACRERVCQYV